MIRSFWLWPIPYQRGEVTTSLARPKKVIVTLLRMLGLAKKIIPPVTSRTPGLAKHLPAPGNVHARVQAPPLPHRQAVHEGARDRVP
jgi:hypothetical protein